MACRFIMMDFSTNSLASNAWVNGVRCISRKQSRAVQPRRSCLWMNHTLSYGTRRNNYSQPNRKLSTTGCSYWTTWTPGRCKTKMPVRLWQATAERCAYTSKTFMSPHATPTHIKQRFAMPLSQQAVQRLESIIWNTCSWMTPLLCNTKPKVSFG